MTVFHTSAGGAAIWIEAVTRLIGGENGSWLGVRRERADTPRRQWLGLLPHSQRVFDR